ncbi:MAG: ThiF family adenylyltransferase [Cyanobacteria bacterium P01_A01_bin.114]
MLNPNLDDIQLTKDDYERYSRHIILPEVGLEGQKKLKAASVLCVGTGGLGHLKARVRARSGTKVDLVTRANAKRQKNAHSGLSGATHPQGANGVGLRRASGWIQKPAAPRRLRGRR